MIVDECPYCGIRRVAAAELAAAAGPRQPIRNTPSPGHFIKPSQPQYTWTICQCNHCQNLVLIRGDPGTDAQTIIYPARRYDLDSSLKISSEIRDEYAEAGRCLDAGCYKASMVMGRRVLQRLLKEQGCNQGKLSNQITHAVEQDILRKLFHRVAEEVRHYGNLGAHPDDDQLKNCTRENAETLLNFVCLLVEEFYTLPAKAAALKSQRKGQDNSAAASAPDQAATAKRPR